MLANSGADTNVMPRGRRGKTRLKTLTRLDGRTAAAKRARHLVEMWTQALGGDVSPHTAMLVTHAAASVVLCESAQARMLSGDPTISASEVGKLTNIASRAVRALNLPAAGPQKRGSGLKRLKLLP